MSNNRLQQVLEDRGDNYILPFFWQKNETDDALIREIDAIATCGIRALCVEARGYAGFGTDAWWHTMDVILAECRKRGMKVWLLDDKAFPTGNANGAFLEHPELAACGITEVHVDVPGPVKGGRVMAERATSGDDKLIAVLACERVPYEEALTGKVINVTDNVDDGMVYFDLPEGCWRILFLYKTRTGMHDWGKQYADMLCPAATDLLIERVYEAHYKRYADYFGNTFAGFFSDEPCLANGVKIDKIVDFGTKNSHYPWRDEMVDALDGRLDGGLIANLPALWYDFGPATSKARYEYMDFVSKRYGENLSWKLGNWCRAHGVEYIGHVIEDLDQCSKTGYGDGHYFRALDGQDMGGIDTVLGQTTPGMTDHIIKVPCHYDIGDPDFFHFTLPKLAPSHAHLQPLKKGRAMCEIFGAYGWVEGVRMMKWMTDLMLSRGVNYYVPHAFTPTFPNPDCPPHFNCEGTNPQFEAFGKLMRYTNRVCHLLNGGRHVSTAAVLYHVEAEWAGKEYTPCDRLCRLLTEHQLDYDIIPADYLAAGSVAHNTLTVNGESYGALLVPSSAFLPKNTLALLQKLADAGLPVIFAGAKPEKTADAPDETAAPYLTGCPSMTDEGILSWLQTDGRFDVKTSSPARFLRSYHYVHDAQGLSLYWFSNEDIHNEIKTAVRIAGFTGGEYGIYDPMENTFVKATSINGEVPLVLSPYGSVIYVIGTMPNDVPTLQNETTTETIVLPGSFAVSVSAAKDYPHYTPYKTTGTLFNVSAKDELPRFSGRVRYDTSLTLTPEENRRYVLDLGAVGECASVSVNGKNCGLRITPPYRYDITDALQNGENAVCIDVTTNYGHELRDYFSRFFLFEPTGLLGPVTVDVLTPTQGE